MAILGLAAVSKFLDIERFAADLRTWTLIPAEIHAALSLGIPLLEGGASLAWFLNLGRPAAVFAAALVTETILVGPPKCGCLGAMLQYEQTVGATWLLIGRNLLLLVALIVGGGATVRATRRCPELAPVRERPRVPPLRRPVPHRSGFTLLEVLITLAIIAILVSLILPSLARVREDARELKSTANLRSHAVTHSTYAGDNGDSLLHVSDPMATATILRGGGHTASIPYFKLFQSWNIALADEYLGGDAMPDSMRIPWKQPFLPWTHYYYGDCFIARPEYWNYRTRLADRSQWRGTTIGEVSFPSSKGLIFEQGWTADTRGVFEISAIARASFVDGSVAEARYSTMNHPYVYGAGPSARTGGGYDWGIPVMHTIDGVRGRDLP